MKHNVDMKCNVDVKYSTDVHLYLLIRFASLDVKCNVDVRYNIDVQLYLSIRFVSDWKLKKLKGEMNAWKNIRKKKITKLFNSVISFAANLNKAPKKVKIRLILRVPLSSNI